jgi:hypothetical protein
MIIPTMANRARVTVTLPDDLVRDIDRRERNRSKFILEAVEKELEARRRQELLASVASPHPQSEEIGEAGLGEWGDLATHGDDDLLDPTAGIAVRWRRDDGWVEVDE